MRVVAVQGIGGGGILNLTEVIISDLIPLAERGTYQGFLAMVWSLASGIGPPIVSASFSIYDFNINMCMPRRT